MLDRKVFMLIAILFMLWFILKPNDEIVRNTGTLKSTYKPKHPNPFLIKDPEIKQFHYDVYPNFNETEKKTSFTNYGDISKIEKQLASIQFKPMNMNVTRQNTIIPLNELSGVMNRLMCSINKVCDNIVLVGIHKSNRALAQINGEKWATYTLQAEMYNVNANQTLQMMLYASVRLNSGKTIPDFKIHSVNLSTTFSLKDGEEAHKKLTYNETNELYNISECPEFSTYIIDQ